MRKDKGQPFDGVKVVEFSWFGVGPRTIKFLAEYGAQVIKVESVNATGPREERWLRLRKANRA